MASSGNAGTPGQGTQGPGQGTQVQMVTPTFLDELSTRAENFRNSMLPLIRDPALLDQAVLAYVQQQLSMAPQGASSSSTTPLVAMETVTVPMEQQVPLPQQALPVKQEPQPQRTAADSGLAQPMAPSVTAQPMAPMAATQQATPYMAPTSTTAPFVSEWDKIRNDLVMIRDGKATTEILMAPQDYGPWTDIETIKVARKKMKELVERSIREGSADTVWSALGNDTTLKALLYQVPIPAPRTLAPSTSTATPGQPQVTHAKPPAPTHFVDRDQGTAAKGKGKRDPGDDEEPKGKGKRAKGEQVLDGLAINTIDYNRTMMDHVKKYLGNKELLDFEDYAKQQCPDWQEVWDTWHALYKEPMTADDEDRVKEEWLQCIFRQLYVLRQGIFRAPEFRTYDDKLIISKSGHFLHPEGLWILWHRGGSPKPSCPMRIPEFERRGLGRAAAQRPRGHMADTPEEPRRRYRDPNQIWPPMRMRIPQALWVKRGTVARNQCYVCEGLHHHGHMCKILWAWYRCDEGEFILSRQGIELPEEIIRVTATIWQYIEPGVELNYPVDFICTTVRRILEEEEEKDFFRLRGDYLYNEELAEQLGWPRDWERIGTQGLEAQLEEQRRRSVAESQGIRGGHGTRGGKGTRGGQSAASLVPDFTSPPGTRWPLTGDPATPAPPEQGTAVQGTLSLGTSEASTVLVFGSHTPVQGEVQGHGTQVLPGQAEGEGTSGAREREPSVEDTHVKVEPGPLP
jgi:hypothetical protein